MILRSSGVLAVADDEVRLPPPPVLTQQEAVAVAFAQGVIDELADQQRFPGPVEETFREQSRALAALLKRSER